MLNVPMGTHTHMYRIWHPSVSSQRFVANWCWLGGHPTLVHCAVVAQWPPMSRGLDSGPRG
jgi:hypothetical protein